MNTFIHDNLGAYRGVNKRGVEQIGDACGFDSINDQPGGFRIKKMELKSN